MSNAMVATSANWDTEVLGSSVPVLVDFWAEWCGPCKAIGPHVDAIAEEFADKAKVYKVDVDQEGELAMRYGVMSIPALFIFKDGKVVQQMVGARGKEDLAAALREHV